ELESKRVRRRTSPPSVPLADALGANAEEFDGLVIGHGCCAAQRTGAQLPAAVKVPGWAGRPPPESPQVPDRASQAAGSWKAGQADQRRPVSCSALLGGAILSPGSVER